LAATFLFALALSSAASGRQNDHPQWGWWVGNTQGFFFSLQPDGLHEVDFRSIGMCGSELSALLGETLTAAVTPDGSGNFGGSATDQYGQEYHFQGHLGATHATGTFRIVSAPSFCPDGGRGDTGIVSFDATCFLYCPVAPPPPPPPLHLRLRRRPAGDPSVRLRPAWSVAYPATPKLATACSTHYYEGLPSFGPQ
jgi:hypothetical protein